LTKNGKRCKNPKKKKYEQLFQEEKQKYKADIEIVRHYLFKDVNDNVQRPPTAYRLFLNEKLREGLVQGINPKKIKEEASSQWKNMSKDDKLIYNEKKKENDNWLLKAEKIKKVSPISLFVQKKIKDAKKEKKDIPLLKDISSQWKQLPDKKKNLCRLC
jgi:hypothetical protein